MLEDENLYCNLFIDFEGEPKEAEDLIAELTKGIINSSPWFIETTFAELDVRKNDGYKTLKEMRSPDPDDGFLFWKYHIDIEPSEYVSRSIYISNVSKLILKLWAKGINAVAACSFEDELPKRE